MKLSSILSAAMLAASMPALAAGLSPTQFSVGDRPMTYPLEEISVSFDTEVDLGPEVSAWLALDNGDYLDLCCIPVGVSVDNYVGSTATQGTVIFRFDKQNLPLGKAYTFGIDAGSVVSRHDPSLTNDELRVQFEVPADLGEARFDIPESGIIDKAESIWCYWGIETEPVGEPEFILYREGVETGRYPAHIGWDWNLGQAYVDFGETMKFDRGVNYTLLLPAGSACGMWRSDLLNPEARLDFTGGYDPAEDPEPLDFSVEIEWPNLLRLVRFRFQELPWPVPAPGAKAQLYEADGSCLVAEADLYLNTQVNHCEIDADFGGFPLEDSMNYTIVIPEGALLFEDETGVRTCGSKHYSFKGTAGVAEIGEELDGTGELYDLRGIRVDRPQSGEIYIRDGRKIIWR